jgi:hypothetical protein
MSKKYSRKQKLYKMKGCSKNTRKNYLGGKANIQLAYPSYNIKSVPNPFLAYTGKGGSNSMSININSTNPTLPNTGPVPKGNIFLNPINPQRGGNCGCGIPLLSGGKKKNKTVGFLVAGARHRMGCKCSECKKMMKGGNHGIPYPNGLVGSSWRPQTSSWPGVNGIPGDSNHYPLNTYQNDISRQIKNVGANPPFIGGKKKQKGGNLSNFITQDLINLGRQFQYGVGSAYNAIAGYSSPVNPLPWKDQFPKNPYMTSLTPSVI